MTTYSPGFFAALFLVLLRMSIGWHLWYEGQTKIDSYETDRPFSAEVYLRNAIGPLADRFRAMVPDIDGLEALDREALKANWNEELQLVADHFGFNREQRAQAQELLDQTEAEADAWFDDPEIAQDIADYHRELERIHEWPSDRPLLAYERELIQEARLELDAERRRLLAPINDWTTSLRASWIELATPEQVAASGEYNPPPSELDRVNTITMYGLWVVGLCLMFGFLTPLAALGAAGFLFMFYISMPPFPGLPPNPMAEGTYLFVNKNLIEMFACLALACIPTGMWVGVDALLFGWLVRRWRRPRAETAAQ